MDNGILFDQSTILGTESGHITLQVLYQEIISAHESTPRASEINFSKSTARLPQKLPCQDLTYDVKTPLKTNLPPNLQVLVDKSS